MVSTLTIKQHISPEVRRTSYIKKKLHETENLGWGCSSVVEDLFSMCERLGLIPSTAKIKQTTKTKQIKPTTKTRNLTNLHKVLKARLATTNQVLTTAISRLTRRKH